MTETPAKALADELRTYIAYNNATITMPEWSLLLRCEATLRSLPTAPADGVREALETAYDALGIVRLEDNSGPDCLREVNKARDLIDAILTQLEGR